MSVAPGALPALAVKQGEYIAAYRVASAEGDVLELRADNATALGCGLVGIVLIAAGLFVFGAALGFVPGIQLHWVTYRILGPVEGTCLFLGGAGIYVMVMDLGKAYRFDATNRRVEQSRGPLSRRSWPADSVGSVQLVTSRIGSAGNEVIRIQLMDKAGAPLLKLDDTYVSGVSADGTARLAVQIARQLGVPLDIVGRPDQPADKLKKTLEALIPAGAERPLVTGDSPS
ncbi:MAG TPA: hypothetical protein VKT77_17065 [Chthonomonadaceae bacterium]|nr:hypothetical protein [Chthonomonadaceae bacterium]